MMKIPHNVNLFQQKKKSEIWLLFQNISAFAMPAWKTKMQESETDQETKGRDGEQPREKGRRTEEIGLEVNSHPKKEDLIV